MAIDKYIILTLKRSTSRQWAMLGGCAARQIPIEKVNFFVGYDETTHPGTMFDVATAAETDGFSYVHQFAQGWGNEVVQQSINGVYQAWNFGRMLRYIARGTETCLITWDDRLPTLPFPFFNQMAVELESRKEEFFLWQLRARFSMNDSYFEPEIVCRLYPDLIGGIEVAHQELKRMVDDYWNWSVELNEKWQVECQEFLQNFYTNPQTPSTHVTKYIQKNMVGFDESMVISPRGAAWLLLQALNMKQLELGVPVTDETHDDFKNLVWWEDTLKKRIGIDSWLFDAMGRGKMWEDPIIRRTCMDSWLLRDCKTELDKALAENKGIYTSKSIGARYIGDLLPMGSMIEWTPATSSLNTDRQQNTEIQFIENE